MALFEAGNPTLTQKIFDRSATIESDLQGTMSVRGAMNKFGFLLLMVIAGACFSWHTYSEGQYSTTMTLALIGVFGGAAMGFIVSFFPKTAPYLAAAYGLLEGLAVGAVSAIINDELAKKYPGVVIQAVGLTLGVAFAMFLLYNFRIIKVTQRMRSIVYTAFLGVAVFYLIDVILFYVFRIDIPITSWENTSAVSIGFSLLMIGLAAFKLLIDFWFIEEGAAQGLPKYMEWYSAFGLTVTIVWLYFEMLKLLSRLAKRD